MVFLAGCASSPFAQWSWLPWFGGDEKEPRFPEIAVSAAWLAERLDSRDLAVVDARHREAYHQGHIPTALSLPPDSLARMEDFDPTLGLWGLSPDLRIVCYGDQASLPAAARLFWLLEVAGAKQVLILDGGIDAWRSLGQKLTTSEPTASPKRWYRAPHPHKAATTDYILDRYGRPGCEIIDARATGLGETLTALDTPGSPWGAGHIPHSLPVDLGVLIQEDGTLLEPAAIRSYVAEVGPRPSTTVDLNAEFIVYDDGSSNAGALGYLLLRRAGIEQVRYYPGGWREWSAEPGLPVVRILEAEELRDRLLAEVSSHDDIPPHQFILLDVRHGAYYSRAHIPGAVSLPSDQFQDSLAVVLDRHWPGVDRQATPIVVYCYGPLCIHSRDCSTLAAQAGFLHPEWFRGGFDAWEQLGAEVIRAPRAQLERDVARPQPRTGRQMSAAPLWSVTKPAPASN